MPWPFGKPYPQRTGAEVHGQTYDYVIVGAGTAGCVLASRLSEPDPVTGQRASVLVLEKGRASDWILTRIPLMSQNMFMDFMQAVRDSFAAPLDIAYGKRLRLWAAEGIGGSSRVNAMLHSRGSPGAYVEWADGMGLSDWNWDKVQPYFNKMETVIDRPDDPSRGHNGPIPLRQMEHNFRFYPYLEKVFNGLGLPTTHDPNSPKAPAQCYKHMEVAIDPKSRRTTAFQGYLNKSIALERQENLTICTGVSASRLDLDAEAGQVKGVYFRPANKAKPGSAQGQQQKTTAKTEFYVKARREVIVCNGTLRTPQLLLLSGIGPKAHLEKFGIPVAKDLPAVGQNLADHICFPVQAKVAMTESLRQAEHWFWALWGIVMYFFFNRGIFSTSSTNYAAFLRTTTVDRETMTVKTSPENMDAMDPANIPDLELMINAINSLENPMPGYPPMLAMHTALLQPHSQGSLELASTDPDAHPSITYPFLDDPRDVTTARTAIRFSMRVLHGLATSGYPLPCPLVIAPGVNTELIQPSPGHTMSTDGSRRLVFNAVFREPVPQFVRDCDREHGHVELRDARDGWRSVTDADVDEFARLVGSSGAHLTSTCRMDNDPARGVVDQQLRVHGFANLRLADASVFPKIPACHTMAPVLMVGERCADFVKDAWRDRKER
ncbi:hypothetical protein MCOR22_001751 [Pyricularia oryzae]|nr:hypothetical protein MCOR22_001751 [Pyricularia oryzae]